MFEQNFKQFFLLLNNKLIGILKYVHGVGHNPPKYYVSGKSERKTRSKRHEIRPEKERNQVTPIKKNVSDPVNYA